MLGVEINKLSSSGSSRPRRRRSSSASSFELDPLAPNSPNGPTATLHLNAHPDTDYNAHSSTGELSGVYLGILNLFTTLPQFVGTFISMIVFEIFEPGKSPELHEGDSATVKEGGVNAISICLAIGALSMLVAAVASRRLKEAR
jgi:solute carrier family 45 protein 1/2/4